MPPSSSRVGSRSSTLPNHPSSSRALGRVFLLLLLPFFPPTFPPSGLSVAAAVSHDTANTRRDHATVRKMAAAPRKAAAAAAASPSRGTMSVGDARLSGFPDPRSGIRTARGIGYCTIPLTSKSKARVTMLGSTLKAETMMLRWSPRRTGSILRGGWNWLHPIIFFGGTRGRDNVLCGANSVTVAI